MAPVGGTLVIAHELALPTLGVLHTADGMAGQIQRDMLFMPLIKLDNAMEPVPWLAESWDTIRFSPDSLELSFQLRKDVAWHDGVPTTAEDVRFTFERIMDPRTGAIPRRHFSLYSRHVDVPDPWTIRFRLRASGGFLTVWADVPPLPRHLLHEVPPELLVFHPFGREPIGNGPFRFQRRTSNEEWVFEANSGFPAELGGRPQLDRVVIRTSLDQSTRFTELLVGGIDVTHILPSQVEEARAASGIRLLDVVTPRWAAVFWNTRLPQFTDARVRRALTLALDRQAITDGVLLGHGTAGRSPITPFQSFFAAVETEAPSSPFDPEAALALMADAGWTDRGDGLLRDDRGNPLRFTISVIAGAGQHNDAAQIIQAQLSRIGVEVRIRPVEYTTLLQDMGAGAGGSRGFEALLMSVAGEPRKDDSFFFHSRYHEDIGHLSGFSSPDLDSLLDTLALSLDQNQDLQLWQEYQRLLAHESPATVLFYPLSFVGVADRLQGVEVNGLGILGSIARWRVVDP